MSYMNYEERLEVAKRLYELSNTEQKTALECIFPELCESEDEKIRKKLIDLIYKVYANTSYITCVEHEDMLAWLEKQGEQKSKKVPIWKHWKDGICGNGEGKLIYLIKEGGDYSLSSSLGYECDYILLSDLDNLMIEKQGTSYTKRDVDNAFVEGMALAKDELEKQGKKPTLPKWKYKKDHTPLLRDSIILNKYGGVAKSPSGAIVSDVWVLDYDELAKLPKEELKKQGEQKPTDMVESKFKVGDWIAYNHNPNLPPKKIIQITNKHYVFADCSFETKTLETDWHLWTIKDAKAGDVLAAHECYVIFKEIDGLNIKCYCTYHYMNNPSFHVDTLHNKDAFHPATKEQRVPLEKAISDAGYTFDFEKKELKKIEQNNEMVEALRTEYEKGRADAFAQMQKEWSEEDEQTKKFIIEYLERLDRPTGNSCINWLKSLKCRVQPKQEWSKEDEFIALGIEQIVNCASLLNIAPDSISKIRNWLKSLKDRYTWKPSDEQMEELSVAKNSCFYLSYKTKNALKSLYKDLKKLK